MLIPCNVRLLAPPSPRLDHSIRTAIDFWIPMPNLRILERQISVCRLWKIVSTMANVWLLPSPLLLRSKRVKTSVAPPSYDQVVHQVINLVTQLGPYPLSSHDSYLVLACPDSNRVYPRMESNHHRPVRRGNHSPRQISTGLFVLHARLRLSPE